VTPRATLDPEATLAERVTSLFMPVTVKDHVGSIAVSFTPEDVAQKTGVRADQIRALMDGTLTLEDAPVMLLKRIADFFGIPVMYLIDASDAAAEPVNVEQTLALVRELNSRGFLKGALQLAANVEDEKRVADVFGIVLAGISAMEKTKPTEPQADAGAAASA
jgi:hypothetical protein